MKKFNTLTSIIISLLILSAGLVLTGFLGQQIRVPRESKILLFYESGGGKPFIFDKVEITQKGRSVKVRREYYTYYISHFPKASKGAEIKLSQGNMSYWDYRTFWINLMKLEPFKLKDYYEWESVRKVITPEGEKDETYSFEGPGILVISYLKGGKWIRKIISVSIYDPNPHLPGTTPFRKVFDLAYNQEKYAKQPIAFSPEECKVTSDLKEIIEHLEVEKEKHWYELELRRVKVVINDYEKSIIRDHDSYFKLFYPEDLIKLSY